MRRWLVMFVLSIWLWSGGGQSVQAQETAKATFAGGCFWCMEKPFDELSGVLSTTSGYTGGSVVDPTYEEVSKGKTGHAESVQVIYDPTVVRYEQLLDVFWHNVDPVDKGGQFCDRGSQYRTSIFYHSASQQQQAERSKAAIAGQVDQRVATKIVPAGPFYPAEDYHQNYYQTHANWYHFYRYTCGRDQRLAQLWPSQGRTD